MLNTIYSHSALLTLCFPEKQLISIAYFSVFGLFLGFCSRMLIGELFCRNCIFYHLYYIISASPATAYPLYTSRRYFRNKLACIVIAYHMCEFPAVLFLAVQAFDVTLYTIYCVAFCFQTYCEVDLRCAFEIRLNFAFI